MDIRITSQGLLPPLHAAGDPLSRASNSNVKKEIARRAQQNASIKRRHAVKTKALVKLESVHNRLVNAPQSLGEYDAKLDSQNDEWPQVTGLTRDVNPSQHDRSLSVRTYLDTSQSDPFKTGKIPLTSEMQSVFMWYFNVILPVVEPIQSEREDYSQWAVPLLSTEPALLFSLLACMAHDIEQATVVGFGPPSRRNFTAERLHYRVRAIQELNKALASPEAALKPSTLLAVHFLLWQEMFAGDECVHLDGVQRILELRGGFGGLQRKALEGVMLGCFWRAIRMRTRPLLCMVSVDRPLTTEEFSSILSTCDPSTARLGEAFFDVEFDQYFDNKMLMLLKDARRAWVCFELIGVHNYPLGFKREATIMRVDVDHRMLSYPFDHYGGFRPIQEAIRQGFVTFSNAHYCVVQPTSKIARCLIEDLKKALDATDLRSCWGSACTALVWVLFHGAHLTFGQRERPWFVVALAKASQNLRLRSWMQARSLLVRFYYVDRVFQESFRKIWEEAELLLEGLGV